MAGKTKTTGYSSSKGKFKWGAFWAGLISFVIVAATIFVFIAVSTMGFKDWSFSRTFPKKSVEQEYEPSGAVIGEGESNGISLMSMAIPVAEYEDYGIDAQSSEKSYKLVASYTPANATVQDTAYTVSWKNEASTWATGKVVTDYVELTHTAHSKEATITILKGFGEQIIIMAQNEKYNDLYATTTVDWLCDNVSFYFGTNPADLNDDYVVDYFSWSGGSLAPTKESRLEIQIYDPGFTSYMRGKGYTNVLDRYSYFVDCSELSKGEGLFTMLNVINGLCGKNVQQDNAMWGVVCGYYNGFSPNDWWAYYDLVLHRVYDGEEIDSVSVDESCDLELGDFSAFEIKVTSMTTNNTGIVVWGAV